MNIHAVHRLHLWCETPAGEIAPIDPGTGDMPPVDTHPYAYARFPLSVRTEIYNRRGDDGVYGDADRIMAGESGASNDLATAMVRSGEFTVSDALIIASVACERCMNALAHQYGVPWGYPEFSEAWQRANTVCVMCG